MTPLDFVAHPVALWALGLVGSFTRTLLRKHEETGRRVMPWQWIVENPGRAISAVVGSVILLAVLARADLLAGSGLLPALLAVGAGALGPEALPKMLDKSKAAIDKVLNHDQRGEAPILPLGILAALIALAGMAFIWPNGIWWEGAAIGIIAPAALAIIIVHDEGWRGLLLSEIEGPELAATLLHLAIISAWWAALLIWWGIQAGIV